MTTSGSRPLPSPAEQQPPTHCVGDGGDHEAVGVDVPEQQQQPQPQPQQHPHCPRCGSQDTKFCYYNNYNLSQPRYFCKSCRRYWTLGGSLRNIPVGGTTRAARNAHTGADDIADHHQHQHQHPQQLVSSPSIQKPRSKRRKRQVNTEAHTAGSNSCLSSSSTTATASPPSSVTEPHSPPSPGKEDQQLPDAAASTAAGGHLPMNDTSTAPTSGGCDVGHHQPPAPTGTGDDAFGFGALLAEPLPLFLHPAVPGYVSDGLGLGLGLTGGYLDYDMVSFGLDRSAAAYAWPPTLFPNGPPTSSNARLFGSDVGDPTNPQGRVSPSTAGAAAVDDACYFSIPGLGVSAPGSKG